MGLESYTQCPSCESDIVLKTLRKGVFGCPHCQAEFRHDYRRWAVVIPVMLFVTLLLWYLLPKLGVWIILGGVFITTPIVGNAPEFRIEVPGQKVLPVPMTRQQKESKFFKFAIFCFFLVAMAALGWSLMNLLNYLLH